MSSLHRRLAATARLFPLLFVMASGVAFAQCETGWLAGVGVPGTNDTIYAATLWDPDGAGPLQPRIVVGGRFTTAGGVPASRVAQWDPATGLWSAMGSGMNNYVLSFATMPNGDLIAGGGFSTAGGVAASYIARWNGTAWSALGGGAAQALNGDVYALAVMPSGELVAGGIFQFAGFTLVNYIASWNGTTWSPLLTGTNNHVLALTVMPGGDLVAGGYFTVAGGTPANRIARWSGGAWTPLGTGVDSGVFALARLPNGDVAAGGNFQNAGGAPASRLARWSAVGGSWSPFGLGVNFDVHALAVLPGGDLVTGGNFTASGALPAKYIARWNGVAWTGVGIGMDTFVRTIVPLPSGAFFVGGNFTTAGGVPASGLALACGNANWTATGAGCAGTGGVPALTMVTPPQIGSPFTLAVNGLGSGVPLMVTGLSPLNAALFPLGLGFGFGCTLFAAPDILQVVGAVGGSGTWSLALPNDPSLAGVHVWNQVLELGAVSAASNGGDGEIR